MKTTTLIKDDLENEVLADSLALMKKDGFLEEEILRFTNEADAVLDA